MQENVIACDDGQFQLEHLIPHSTIKPNALLSFYRKTKVIIRCLESLLAAPID